MVSEKESLRRKKVIGMRWAERLRMNLMRQMQGRYGVDRYSQVLLVIGVAAVFLSALLPGRYLGGIFYLLGWIAVVYSYIRIFSRNVTKRYEENQRFLEKTYGIRYKWAKIKHEWKQRQKYHIYRCPGCRQKIRIPRGKGRVEIRCPKCQTTFIRKS
jgi:LSD1 subclass zinc finger protein